MNILVSWFRRCTEFIAASMLAAIFFTFLLQIWSRYVMAQPFGWTLELCLTLWLWSVFFGCAFIVRPKDHVTFDIFYLAAPSQVRRVLALVIAIAIAGGLLWSLLPTWDYIDFLKRRGTSTIRVAFVPESLPFYDELISRDKIRLRTVFSIYICFLVAVSLRYAWMGVSAIFRWKHLEVQLSEKEA